MNKVDLIPKTTVSDWLTFLRKSHPTIAVKAGKNSGQAKGEGALLNSSSAVGMEGILQLLKNYARNDGSKSKGCITVGVIGYPNVGKSSIINSLKRTRAVGVSARPGFTTCSQEVVLDKNVRLLDCPGVVFDDVLDDDNSSVLLRNCIDVDKIDDPMPTIQELIKRCNRKSLMMTYAIPAFPAENAEIFLAMVAKKLGKVKKGGIPDKVMAARVVLRDWNSGKIPFYTPPPSDEDQRSMVTEDKHSVMDEPTIVHEFGKQFDVELMKTLDDKDEMDFVQLEPAPLHDVSEKTAEMFVTRNNDEIVDGSTMETEEESVGSGLDNADMEEAEDFNFSAK